jgi:hypothetical protein
MNTCSCGNAAIHGGPRCPRCESLRVLGLEDGANEVQIKFAYRMMVKVWHPDRFPGDPKLRQSAEEKIKAINIALAELTSPGSRARPRPQAPRTSPPHQSPANPAPGSPKRPSRPRQFRRTLSSWFEGVGMALLVRCLILLVILAASILCIMMLDGAISSNPTIGSYYSHFKAQLLSDFDSARQRMLGSWIPHKQQPAPEVSEPATAAASGNPSALRSPGRPAPRPASAPKPARLLPVITVGLTQAEVIATQGEPTSSTAGKFVYGNSEIYFKAGEVVGWKIDPASPLRVKLWPDAPVDPDLRSFTVGSSRNEVLAVQGTPTWFSQDEFRYGASAVLFRNGRVVSWKCDPNSIPLRAVPR